MNSQPLRGPRCRDRARRAGRASAFADAVEVSSKVPPYRSTVESRGAYRGVGLRHGTTR